MARGFKFNPGFQSDDEAVANFVVRGVELENIISRLREAPSISARTLRLLVVAPRGAGKTTLCRRVVAETRRSPDLRHWEPIFLGEESYVVTTPGEFFLECLAQLVDQTRDAKLAAAHQKALGAATDDDLLNASIGALRMYASATHRKLLLIVENFHMIMRDQIGNGAGTLLSALNEPALFGILATSVVQAGNDEEEFVLRDFETIPLKPLTLPECQLLWSSLTGKDVSSERIRPLQILTGGSPRLMHILSEFMNTPSLHDLMGKLNFLIDNNTEYFKSQLDALPTIERKVFAALLDIWDPTTAKQIAETARVNTNTASSMLARLADRGSVIKEQGEGRAAIYYAAERLFNIYYLMRRRSSPSSRVKALVSFMTGYYDKEELISTTAQIVREACGLSPDRRAEYHSTFDAILLKSPESVRSQILKQTPADFLNSLLAQKDTSSADPHAVLNLHFGGGKLHTDADTLLERADAAESEGRLDEASQLLAQALIVQPESQIILSKQTLLSLRLDRVEAAIASAKLATTADPDSATSYILLGLSLGSASRFDEADKALSQAMKLDPKSEMARDLLASLREANGRSADAIKLFKNSRKLSDRSRVQYAHLLADQGRPEEAETVLRNNLARGPDTQLSRRALVDLLESQGRQLEGISLLREDAERSDHWKSWGDLGTYLLMRTDDIVGARDALARAIDEGADAPRLFELLGQALVATGADPDSVSGLAKTVEERFGETAIGWIIAGNIYNQLKHLHSAELAYRRAAESEKGSEGLSSLARLLASIPGRTDEAASLFRDILKSDQDEECSTSRDYAKLLVRRGEDSEAKKVLRTAIGKNKNCYCCIVLEAEIFARAGNDKKAKSSYERALKLHKDGVAALTGLSRLVDGANAEKLIDRAIIADSRDPRPLLERARRGSEVAGSDDARSALRLDANLFEAHLFLAEYEARSEKIAAAIEHLETVLDALPERRDLTPAFVRSCMVVARIGDIDAVKDLISKHQNGRLVEPLAIAIRVLAGENPVVAKEVMEVAQDILRKS